MSKGRIGPTQRHWPHTLREKQQLCMQTRENATEKRSVAVCRREGWDAMEEETSEEGIGGTGGDGGGDFFSFLSFFLFFFSR